MGKLACAVLLLLSLGGCSIVTSETPLFSASDVAGAPRLKPGLWSMPDGDCAFDSSGAPQTWPKCANATVVTASTVGDARGEGGTSKQTIPYLLAAGDPLVMQLQAPPDREPDDPVFIFAGMRPTARDRRGQVVEMKVWLALCVEPPAGDKALERYKPGPLPPGLKPGKAARSCIAADKAAARDAARRSEPWAFRRGPTAMGLTARWVRDAAP